MSGKWKRNAPAAECLFSLMKPETRPYLGIVRTFAMLRDHESGGARGPPKGAGGPDSGGGGSGLVHDPGKTPTGGIVPARGRGTRCKLEVTRPWFLGPSRRKLGLLRSAPKTPSRPVSIRGTGLTGQKQAPVVTFRPSVKESVLVGPAIFEVGEAFQDSTPVTVLPGRVLEPERTRAGPSAFPSPSPRPGSSGRGLQPSTCNALDRGTVSPLLVCEGPLRWTRLPRGGSWKVLRPRWDPWVDRGGGRRDSPTRTPEGWGQFRGPWFSAIAGPTRGTFDSLQERGPGGGESLRPPIANRETGVCPRGFPRASARKPGSGPGLASGLRLRPPEAVPGGFPGRPATWRRLLFGDVAVSAGQPNRQPHGSRRTASSWGNPSLNKVPLETTGPPVRFAKGRGLDHHPIAQVRVPTPFTRRS